MPLRLQITQPTVLPDSLPSPKEGLRQLSTMSFDDLVERFVNGAVELAINVAIALVVFYVGKFIIKKIYKVVAAIMIRRNADKSLSTFILSLIRIVLYFILIVTVIGILGLETSSFLAIFASAGVAIGMALSGTLQNFAGGVLILLLKPYKIGDYIEAQGFAGTVTEIQIFHTIINTYDNKSIIIPNGGLSTGSINNWSREEYRRVSWDVAISYGDSVETARDTILNLFANDERIVKHFVEDDREMRRQRLKELATHDNPQATADIETEPTKRWWRKIFTHKKKVQSVLDRWQQEKEAKVQAMLPKTDRTPTVVVNQLGDNSVVLIARAWTRSEYYWSVFYEINEKIYNALPEAGITFPFPQLDVHLCNADTAGSPTD